MTPFLITIDGPAGTGKSTVSQMVARHFGIPHLDTGAFYRAATLVALDAGLDPDDEPAVLDLIDSVTFDQIDGVMFIGKVDVSKEIRDSRVSAAVSAVSAHPLVRRSLVDRQRRWVAVRGNAAVVEGRDIGSVVFPDANLKIYLDATPEVRARRRAIETGRKVDEVLVEQTRRDLVDSSRNASPLVVPDGAVVIDTSKMSTDQVVAAIVKLAAQPSSKGALP